MSLQVSVASLEGGEQGWRLCVSGSQAESRQSMIQFGRKGTLGVTRHRAGTILTA